MNPTETPTPSLTRDALLDAAEVLFVEHGLEGASLRAITQRAGANLAAVNYHFGSKEGLVRAVFHRRLAPLQTERLRLLDLDEALPGGGSIEGVLRAFMAPPFVNLWQTEAGRSISRLFGRIFHEPNDDLRKMLISELEPSIGRFVDALRRHLPELPHDELIWRFHFAVGGMAQTLSCGDLMELFSHGLCTLSDPDDVLERLIRFSAAGLRSPLPSALPGPSARP
jgi:AcrR family transcriptional regulator